MVNLRPQQFQKLILRWFENYGRKHLPWQQNKTPYRVLVSEIMLQQTQVKTVIPYFERFMQQFPDFSSLANAKEDTVLYFWSGLGYYSRARNLHRCAKIVVEKFGGELSPIFLELQTLPGIGQSTAGAILSIAFNQPYAMLDGNVKRVLTRFHSITEPIDEKNVENTLWALAKTYTPKQRVADYTQAMMDLGATVCTRRNPHCACCPLVRHCLAHKRGISALLPYKKTSRELPTRTATFLMIKKDEQILLQKRPALGIWGGLWGFPEIAGKPNQKAIRIFCKQHFQITVKHVQLLNAFRHTFSHYHLDIFPAMIALEQPLTMDLEEAHQIWYNRNSSKLIGLPKPVQSLLREVE